MPIEVEHLQETNYQLLGSLPEATIDSPKYLHQKVKRYP